MYACFLCDKTVDRGNTVSHAKNRHKTLRKPNLHRARIDVDGEKFKVMLCTKCLRRVRTAQREELEVSSNQEPTVKQ
jgi:large subunit ribosomal protein L28